MTDEQKEDLEQLMRVIGPMLEAAGKKYSAREERERLEMAQHYAELLFSTGIMLCKRAGVAGRSVGDLFFSSALLAMRVEEMAEAQKGLS